MASLSDLASVYAPEGPETGFRLADIEQASNSLTNNAAIGRERTLRNFNQFDLPDLLSSQAARGAFNSSATDHKRSRLATGAADTLTDIDLGLASARANLATNALLAQTGIQLGSLY